MAQSAARLRETWAGTTLGIRCVFALAIGTLMDKKLYELTERQNHTPQLLQPSR
jgi:hypothetical protein